MRSSYHNSRPWIIALSLLTLVGAAFLLVFIWWTGPNNENGNNQQAVTLFKAPPVLLENRRYEQCGHSIEEKRELSDEIRRLSPREIAQLYNADTYHIDEERLRLFNRQPGLCPNCKEHIFVGLDGDEVAVFYGLPGGPQQLKERTQIRTGSLPSKAVADLELGITVANQEELLHVLEGLMN